VTKEELHNKAKEGNESVVVYSDKFGDTFFTPISDPSAQHLLLGHLSIITQLVTLL
jgi:hypothetical protein